MTDACVTLEHHWCYVTLSTDENTLVRLCAGISIHGIAIRDLTVNLANKYFKVPFDILLACLDKRQDSRVPNETLFYLFSELSVKMR